MSAAAGLDGTLFMAAWTGKERHAWARPTVTGQGAGLPVGRETAPLPVAAPSRRRPRDQTVGAAGPGQGRALLHHCLAAGAAWSPVSRFKFNHGYRLSSVRVTVTVMSQCDRPVTMTASNAAARASHGPSRRCPITLPGCRADCIIMIDCVGLAESESLERPGCRHHSSGVQDYLHARPGPTSGY